MSLPPIKDFLAGKDGIKPHHHPAADLHAFLENLSKEALTPLAEETITSLKKTMQNPAWVTAHDAAHDGLKQALAAVETPAFSAHEATLKAVYNARAPQVETLRSVLDQTLRTHLTPFREYLRDFGSYVRDFAGLQPQNIIAKKIAEKPAVEHAPVIDILGMAEKNEGMKSICPDPACAECVPELVKKATLQSNDKKIWWVAGIVAAVGIGAYLINEYGKPKNKGDASKPKDWKARVEPTASSEARTL